MMDPPHRRPIAADAPGPDEARAGADSDPMMTMGVDGPLGASDADPMMTVGVEAEAGALTVTPAAWHGPPTPASPDPGRGSRYERTSLHASGGMGSVWLARDSRMDRDVALKEFLARSPAAGPASLRFLREAKITGQLEHPGIVPVYELDADPETGRPFYTMRFIRGRTLTEVARGFHGGREAGADDPLALVGLLAAFVSACNTIAYAHSRGVIHRDLKGENIILGDFGEVIVLDWGLAKRLGDAAEAGADDPFDLEADPTQTVMGQVMGTPAYMAPEQAEGRLDLLGPHTDVFGLGAILYEILTGGPPFTGTTTLEALKNAIRGELTPPRARWPEVSPPLEAACLKALARDPADRYSDASELALEVQGWQDAQRRRAEGDLRRAGDRLRKQQAALVELIRDEVVAVDDLLSTFRRLAETSARILEVERVSIWRYTEDRRAIHCHALFELGPRRHSSGARLDADSYPDYFKALAATDVIAAEDAQNDPRTREFAEGYLKPLGIGAMMEVPILSEAVLCHEHIGPPRRWTPDEELFAIAIGNLAAHAISHCERRTPPEVGRE